MSRAEGAAQASEIAGTASRAEISAWAGSPTRRGAAVADAEYAHSGTVVNLANGLSGNSDTDGLGGRQLRLEVGEQNQVRGQHLTGDRRIGHRQSVTGGALTSCRPVACGPGAPRGGRNQPQASLEPWDAPTSRV